MGASLRMGKSAAENLSSSCLCFGGFWAGCLLLTRTEHRLAVWTHCAHSWGEAFRSALCVPALLDYFTMHSKMPYVEEIKDLHFKSTSLIQIKMLTLFLLGVTRLQWDCMLLNDHETFQLLSSIKSSFSSTFVLNYLLICFVHTKVISRSPPKN